MSTVHPAPRDGQPILDVSVCYVDVDDLERFAALLSAKGIPGEDGRMRG